MQEPPPPILTQDGIFMHEIGNQNFYSVFSVNSFILLFLYKDTADLYLASTTMHQSSCNLGLLEYLFTS